MSDNLPSALIVDDDPVALIVLQHMLESQGFSVIAQSSVAEAQQELETSEFVIIFVDYLMPGETGLDLLEFADGVPVVLLTGYRSQTELDDPRADDVQAYLTKPVSTSDLTSVVAELLDTATEVSVK